MNNRPGPHEGSNEHLAGAGGSSVDDHDGPTPPDDGLGDDLTQIVGDEPRLAALLDRSADVLWTGPDEFTAHRHLVAMRREAAAAVPARPRVLRTASISAAAAVALVVTLAGFGALPAPAQQVLSDVADRVGITIPSPAGHAPGDEVPAQQDPAPETVPGRPGGPDRSELPGLTQDGTLRTPGASDGHIPPGRTEGHSGSDRPTKQDRDVPGTRDVPKAPGEPPASTPPDRAPPDRAEQRPAPPEQPAAPAERSPDKPEQAPGPPAPPDPPPPPPPEPPDVEDPPASGRGSGPSGQGSDDGHTGGDGGQSSRSGDRSGGNHR